MSNDYSDEKLNLFIDEQLETDEMDAIHQAALNDRSVAERLCQIRATRELVRFAYETVPAEQGTTEADSWNGSSARRGWYSFAASLLITIGVFTGWFTNEYTRNQQPVTASDVFQYFRNTDTIDRTARKIMVHVTSGDVHVIKSTLDEIETLLASYDGTQTPIQLDIITYKDGINMLRVNSSPYADRLETLVANHGNVALYACKRSVEKARKKWGRDVVLMPKTITTMTAQELISKRIKDGWVYIKV